MEELWNLLGDAHRFVMHKKTAYHVHVLGNRHWESNLVYCSGKDSCPHRLQSSTGGLRVVTGQTKGKVGPRETKGRLKIHVWYMYVYVCLCPQ